MGIDEITGIAYNGINKNKRIKFSLRSPNT